MPDIGHGYVPDLPMPPRCILPTSASGFVGGYWRAALAAAYPGAALLTDPVDLCDGDAVAASIAAARTGIDKGAETLAGQRH